MVIVAPNKLGAKFVTIQIIYVLQNYLNVLCKAINIFHTLVHEPFYHKAKQTHTSY